MIEGIQGGKLEGGLREADEEVFVTDLYLLDVLDIEEGLEVGLLVTALLDRVLVDGHDLSGRGETLKKLAMACWGASSTRRTCW